MKCLKCDKELFWLIDWDQEPTTEFPRYPDLPTDHPQRLKMIKNTPRIDDADGLLKNGVYAEITGGYGSPKHDGIYLCGVICDDCVALLKEGGRLIE